MKLFSRRQRQSRPENWIMLYYVYPGEHDLSSKDYLTGVGRAQAELASAVIWEHVGNAEVIVFSSEQKAGPHAKTTEVIATSLGIGVEKACFHHEFGDSAITPELLHYLSRGINRFVLVENGSFISNLIRKSHGPTAAVDPILTTHGSVHVMRIQLTEPQLGGKVTEKYFIGE